MYQELFSKLFFKGSAFILAGLFILISIIDLSSLLAFVMSIIKKNFDLEDILNHNNFLHSLLGIDYITPIINKILYGLHLKELSSYIDLIIKIVKGQSTFDDIDKNIFFNLLRILILFLLFLFFISRITALRLFFIKAVPLLPKKLIKKSDKKNLFNSILKFLMIWDIEKKIRFFNFSLLWPGEWVTNFAFHILIINLLIFLFNIMRIIIITYSVLFIIYFYIKTFY